MKKALKSILGRMLYTSGLYHVFLRERAIIVLFHRVDDRLKGNSLTCSVEEFKNYCRFFKKYFDVVDLSTLLDRIEKGADLSRTLAITFDDGYLDNFENAARVLQELELPACFFVATGFIGTEKAAWWDEKLPLRPEWMSWEHVNALMQAGFEVGAHTVNHVDLGKVNVAVAAQEINESKEQLEGRLARPVRLFAYPYGGKDQITDAANRLVREAGFRCCLSAYGGDVRPEDDVYWLRRTTVSGYFSSPHHFGFELAV